MASHTDQQRSQGEPLEGGDGTIDDLKQALVENLEHRGVLGKLRAKVRAEVFHTLEGPQEGVLPTPLSNENLLINELVRDYLSYNGYSNALGVFMAESGQPIERSLDRGFIRDELGLSERRDSTDHGSARPLPLLYGITHALKRRRKEASGNNGGYAECEEEAEEEEAEEEGCGGHPDVGGSNSIEWADPAPVLFTKHKGSSGGSGIA
ncbi:unnamed protein product [Ectocarpus sp. CCAP 1310/34]|nr:unnamed protein product [Ectocarpus sp. CCAP 1310/34]